jgi:hypothetical protein
MRRRQRVKTSRIEKAEETRKRKVFGFSKLKSPFSVT